MTTITLHELDDIQVEGGDDDDAGVTLTIRASDTLIKLTLRASDAVESLAFQLGRAYGEVKTISDRGWPEDADGFIGQHPHGRWYVMCEGVHVADELETRQLAVLTLAQAMVDMGAFPASWERNEWGNGGEPINDEIRALHDEGGTAMRAFDYGGGEPLADGTDIEVDDDGWVDASVVHDWGQFGVAYQFNPYHHRTGRTLMADRTTVRLPDNEEG